MKKALTTIYMLLATIILVANPVDKESARKNAAEVLGKPVETLSFIQSRRASQINESPAYYVFKADDGEGFAIIAGDDALPAVVGYSKTGSLSGSQEMPEALACYLKVYEQYLAQCQQGQSKASSMRGIFSDRPNAGASPLCKSQWDQRAPYNTLCPQKDGKACLTGCVATALAQIMYFWKWPESGKGYGVATDPDGKVVQGSLEHTYQWGDMLNTTAENLQSEAASAAVAQLLYDCGLAVNMTYGTDGSSAGTPIAAMYRNFGYIPTKLRTLMREVFESDAEYFSTIADEIDAGRPVYQAATSSTGSGGDAMGHAYIIDGYDANGFVHVNWGWNGSYDGYFDLAQMNPEGYKFTVNQRILIGIEPAKNGETGEPIEYPYMGSSPNCERKIGDKIAKTVSFKIKVGNIWNLGGVSHTWNMTFGLFNTKGEMLTTINTGRFYQSITLNSSHYYKEDAFEIECKINKSFTGDFAIRTIFKEGDGDWILPDMAGGLKANAVYVKLDANNITFTDGEDYNKGSSSGIVNLEMSSPKDPSIRYFDLQGREVSGDTKGLLIRKQGNSVKKVIVR